MQFASGVLKGSINLSNIAVTNLLSYPPQFHFCAFCISFSILRTLCSFTIISAVVQHGFREKKKAHATGDHAYHKGDDIELRKQPLTAVTGFGLLGQRSHVKANTYSMPLQAAFLIFLKLALTCFSQNLEIFMTAKKTPNQN